MGLLDLPGSISLAWVYKTSARKVDKHPTLNTAPARSVIKTGGPSRVPYPGPPPGPAQRARHTCMGLLGLPGSISPAWREERRQTKKKETYRRKKTEEDRRTERRKKKATERRRRRRKKKEESRRKKKEARSKKQEAISKKKEERRKKKEE